MNKFLKITMILILVLSLLSGCSIEKPFSVTHYTSEWYNGKEIDIHNKAKYMDAYVGKFGKFRDFSVRNSYENFIVDIGNEENIIPYTFCADNDYLYYGACSLKDNIICSVWKQDINGDNEKYKLVEFSEEYRLLQMTVDAEGNIYVFTKDTKDSEGISVSSYFLNKYDAEGNIIWNRDVTDELVYDNGENISSINKIWNEEYREIAEYFYNKIFADGLYGFNRVIYDVNAVYIDDNGDLYAASECGVAIFNTEDGSLKNWFKLTSHEDSNYNYVIGIVSDHSGKKYAVNKGGLYYNLAEINYKGANKNNVIFVNDLVYSRPYDENTVDKNTASYGLNYDLLMRSNEYVYGLDLKNASAKKLFMFANVGVDGENVLFNAELPDGRILIVEELSDLKIEVTVVTPDGEDEREHLSLVIHNINAEDECYDEIACFINYYRVQKQVAEYNGNSTYYRIIAAYDYDLTNMYYERRFDIISTDGKLSGDKAWLLDDYKIEYHYHVH